MLATQRVLRWLVDVGSSKLAGLRRWRRAPRASTKARTAGGRLRGSRKTTNLMPRAKNNVSSSVHAQQSGFCGSRKREVRAGQWLSCSFVSGRRPGSCPGDGRGPKDRPAWPTGGAERSRSAKSGGRAGPCGSAARPAPGFRGLARSMDSDASKSRGTGHFPSPMVESRALLEPRCANLP